MPDGSAFVFKEKTEPTPTANSQGEKIVQPISSVEETISQSHADVKHQSRNTQNIEAKQKQLDIIILLI